MRAFPAFTQHRSGQNISWQARVGAAGFTFFLVKGLLWLLVPALLALVR